MEIISRLPHDLNTKYYACLTYSKGNMPVNHIIRKYHISKASLMRWMNRFDGSKESLLNHSHRPLSPHPNSHSSFEINKISNMIRRNPDIGLNELYSKLRTSIGYARHYASLYRLLKRIGFYDVIQEKHKPYVPKPYQTPTNLGEKWQMDVKFIPKACKANLNDENRYYQYTVIDEASRERFIYPYMEHSSYSTVDFVKRAIAFFGYVPQIIQTDNGFEFTHFKPTSMQHPFDVFCESLGIQHKLIRPRTPRHNGKVERSHRNDQSRFYNYVKFYSYQDLIKQMKAYLYRSNRICMSTLKWLTPIEKRQQLISLNLVASIA